MELIRVDERLMINMANVLYIDNGDQVKIHFIGAQSIDLGHKQAEAFRHFMKNSRYFHSLIPKARPIRAKSSRRR